MVKDFENKVRVVELGLGTTQVSQVMVNGDSMSSGILFGNRVPDGGKLQGDEVIIEVTTLQGAISYLKAINDLLKTWDIKELEGHFEELDKTINLILEK